MAKRVVSHHRQVGPGEHDPPRSLFHGCCALCLEPWPCPTERVLAGGIDPEVLAALAEAGPLATPEVLRALARYARAMMGGDEYEFSYGLLLALQTAIREAQAGAEGGAA